MLRDAIKEFVKENSIITKNQHGFMKGHSYQSKPFTFYEEVSSNLDRRRVVNVVYLDFADTCIS